MNTPKLLSICVPLVLSALTATVAAQDTASTLLRLTDRAAAIGQVKVLASHVDRDHVRHVVCKTIRTLKGTLLPTFTLHEADGRICGSALHGLLPGTGVLVFLGRNPSGRGPSERGPSASELILPNPRAVVLLHPEVNKHITSLLRARSPKDRVALLTSALSARHPRVRQDAAFALPLLAGLSGAAAADRDRILVAMRAAIATDSKSGASLIRAAQRLRQLG